MADDGAYGYDTYDKQFGYGRVKELKVDRTRGFVQYKRHVFICHGSSRDWPSDFVRGDPNSLPGELLRALKRRDKEIKTKTIVTVCEASKAAGLEEGDVFIFPDMVKYRLKSSAVDSFVSDVLVKDTLWTQGAMEKLTKGSFVFVCAHGTNDMRSGVCGEVVMNKLNELVKINRLEGVLFPIRCSDIGVPELAANIILFGRTRENKIDGHWYSHVSPCELILILNGHFLGGRVYDGSWRGKMGNEEPMKKFYQYPEWWWCRGYDGSMGKAGSLLKPGGKIVSWGGGFEILEPVWEPPLFTAEEVAEQIRTWEMRRDVEMEEESIDGVVSEEVVEQWMCAARNRARKEEEEQEKEKEKEKKEQRTWCQVVSSSSTRRIYSTPGSGC